VGLDEMSAPEEIAELDRALLLDGQDIVLRHVTGTTSATQVYIDVTCRAFVRGFAPEELVSGITQQDSRVVMSATQINAAEWPDALSVLAFDDPDPRIPTKNRGDLCYIDGRKHSIESARGVTIDATLVRIDMVVRGVA
jgi:hypothetical protein